VTLLTSFSRLLAIEREIFSNFIEEIPDLTFMNNLPKSRRSEIVVQEFEKEILIYDLSINKAYCLNETSTLVYQLCDGKNTVADICNLISKKLHQPVTEDLVWLALDSFKKDNLLEQSEQFEIDFNNLSRRQVIRKIGLGSVVMLPLISSIVAPLSAQAQSAGPTNLPLLAACSAPGQCTSGNCFNNTRCCVPGSVGVVGFAAFASLTGTCPQTLIALNTACAGFSPNVCCSGITLTSNGSCESIGGGFVRTQCFCSS
jgi:hypothetical protein